ncbi:putative endonuclease/exonuclease/phosphatase [Rosa chinensis]|uniref:Putative endonuclease/exonuclease/phosphatase n=1 Tax=Rosa chinensis TaxID=74649 RepID=A0A2P6QNZ3_ROSCH|nr:putative endonuclease/exonuclease/phosphatase [Rosa chinensis]
MGGGGLLLMWKGDWKVEGLNSSLDHIDGLATSPTGDVFRITRFYGNPDAQQRSFSWELLRRISYTVTIGWLIFGDFNELLDVLEKNGRRERSMGQILKFRAAMAFLSAI